MVQIGFLARRDGQRDMVYRASAPTLSRKPIWTTEGRLFELSDCVVRRLRSTRPRRDPRLVSKHEKTVKVAPN